jgi:hypothetical protein
MVFTGDDEIWYRPLLGDYYTINQRIYQHDDSDLEESDDEIVDLIGSPPSDVIIERERVES